MRPSLAVLLFCLVAGCATGPEHKTAGVLGPADVIRVETVSNLSGVSVQVPEMYVGDMLGTSDGLDVENMDLRLLTQAALVTALRVRQYRVSDSGATRVLAAAITQWHALDLRRTGRVRMALAVMLVDARSNAELARGQAEREFELFRQPPAEQGTLGDQRFIRRRMEGFVESLAADALRDLGVR